MQLLHVRQHREIERIGGGQAIPWDMRMIAATNRDLASGHFGTVLGRMESWKRKDELDRMAARLSRLGGLPSSRGSSGLQRRFRSR